MDKNGAQLIFFVFYAIVLFIMNIFFCVVTHLTLGMFPIVCNQNYVNLFVMIYVKVSFK